MGYSHLTQAERYSIAAMHASGYGLRQIARELDRSASTVSREYRRNATRYDGHYRAQKAHEYAMGRRHKSRRGSQFSARQWRQVDTLLSQKWSPEQISGRLRKRGRWTMSHETIYRRVKRDHQSGGLLWKNLRIVTKAWRKRRGRPDSRGVLPGKRHISERPVAVEGRRRMGHWEGDTVMGKDQRHCVLTLVERKSSYVVIKKMRARTKEEASGALARALLGLHGRVKTITLDNGTEFHDYKALEQQFRVKFYFATPYHSWERGTNENTNGLIRQYLPKGSCMKHVTQADCVRIQNALNNRPRKKLGFQTPAELMRRS
jgi:IS30 family transposase